MHSTTFIQGTLCTLCTPAHSVHLHTCTPAHSVHMHTCTPAHSVHLHTCTLYHLYTGYTFSHGPWGQVTRQAVPVIRCLFFWHSTLVRASLISLACFVLFLVTPIDVSAACNPCMSCVYSLHELGTDAISRCSRQGQICWTTTSLLWVKLQAKYTRYTLHINFSSVGQTSFCGSNFSSVCQASLLWVKHLFCGSNFKPSALATYKFLSWGQTSKKKNLHQQTWN